MSDATTGEVKLPEPAAWADAFGEPNKTKCHDYKWPLYTADQVRQAVLAERERRISDPDAERYRRLCLLIDVGEYGVSRDTKERDRFGPVGQEFADDKAELDRWLDDPGTIESAASWALAIARTTPKPLP